MGKIKDMIGQKYGRLTVLKFHGLDNNKKNSTWICSCDCGNQTCVSRNNLILKKTLSCGCYNRERFKNQFTKHGQTESETYFRWTDMKTRCLNKNSISYKNYGKRGISICDEWINSFENFISDLGECKKGMTLERLDNNKGYFKENCKWVYKGQQARNRRTVKLDMDKARCIRFLVKNGFKQSHISKFFNCNPVTINYVVSGKTWREDLICV